LWGRTRLTVIYDRLRKRSYRKMRLWNDDFYGLEDWHDHEQHTAYVEGVRDALNAVEEESNEFDKIRDAV
jgi:hypothetical protein